MENDLRKGIKAVQNELDILLEQNSILQGRLFRTQILSMVISVLLIIKIIIEWVV